MPAALGCREATLDVPMAEADVQIEQVSMPVPAPWAAAPRGGISGAQPFLGPCPVLHLSLLCVSHTLCTLMSQSCVQVC